MRTKFLILRFSSIGDIVLTSPVIRCLKLQYPDVEIHYLTKPQYASIAEANPYIDFVHVLNKTLLKKIQELKQLKFDYIIDLHNNLRTQIIKSSIDIPAYSFEKLNVEKSHLVKFKINTLPSIHIVDRYMSTLIDFNIKNDGNGLDFFIPETTTLPENIQPFTQKPFIAIAIGAQHFTKKLPTDKLIAICNQLQLPVLLLGGKEDESIGKKIETESTNKVTSLCGILSLHQSALVVKQCQLLITHDTGLMHIGAALKKKIISVWGNTIPEFGMTPYYGNSNTPNKIFEVNNLSCRPCSKIGFAACPKKHFHCMELQAIDRITETTNKLVTRNTPVSSN